MSHRFFLFKSKCLSKFKYSYVFLKKYTQLLFTFLINLYMNFFGWCLEKYEVFLIFFLSYLTNNIICPFNQNSYEFYMR